MTLQVCTTTFQKSRGDDGSMYCWNSATGVGYPLTLSNCRELCELEISASRPGTMELNLISSITSTKLQRIAFTQLLTRTPQPDRARWIQLDNSLCQLVDRLEGGVRLKVEFQTLNEEAWWDGKLGFKKHLPRFYEKSEAGGR